MRLSKNSLNRLTAIQSAYYLATGIWPIINMRSFEAITGSKREHWLVKTVGAVVTAVGATLAVAQKRQSYPTEIRALGFNVAVAFLAVDCVFVAQRRISRVYLLDAILEAALALAWAASWESSLETERSLRIYLNDHFAGSTAGLELCKRCYSKNRHGELGAFLRRMVREIEEDRKTLVAVMRTLGARPNPLKSGAAFLGEKLARLKLNGRLFNYSPLSRLLELEQLVLGVHGKLELWRALQHRGAQDSKLAPFNFEELAGRAVRQEQELERFRIELAKTLLNVPFEFATARLKDNQDLATQS